VFKAMVSSKRWESDMKAWIEVRWQWVALWVALLCGFYWIGGRIAIGAPAPPNCNQNCICVDGIAYVYFSNGQAVSTTYNYIVPPLGKPQFVQAALASNGGVQYNGTCSGTAIGTYRNQMYVVTTAYIFPLACTPVPLVANAVVALQPNIAWIFPPPPPPPVNQTYCTS
jgi:hypothetical protein